MLTTTEAIVLKSIKYGEKSFVVNFFTKEFGKKTLFARGTSSKNKNFSRMMLEPASILDVVSNARSNQNMPQLNDASWCVIYKTQTTNISKKFVQFFLVDTLNHSVNLSEKNESFYFWIKDILLYIDLQENEYITNVPIFFVYNLLKFLGHDYSNEIALEIIHKHPHLQKSNLLEIKNLVYELNIINNLQQLKDWKIESSERKYFLDILLFNMEYCIPEFRIPNSLKIIKQILY